MTNHDIVEVTITAPDPDWLTDLCHQLVEARLAASAHVIHPVTSVYRWDGAVHQAAEARAFLRSRHALLGELTAQPHRTIRPTVHMDVMKRRRPARW